MAVAATEGGFDASGGETYEKEGCTAGSRPEISILVGRVDLDGLGRELERGVNTGLHEAGSGSGCVKKTGLGGT